MIPAQGVQPELLQPCPEAAAAQPIPGDSKGDKGAAAWKIPPYWKKVRSGLVTEMWECPHSLGSAGSPRGAVRSGSAPCLWQHQGPAQSSGAEVALFLLLYFFLYVFQMNPTPPLLSQNVQSHFRESKAKSRFPLLEHSFCKTPVQFQSKKTAGKRVRKCH